MVTLKSKADTLDALRAHLTRSAIPKSVVFRVVRWREDRARVLDEIRTNFYGQKIIVRSSAINEDTAAASMAGYYTSVGGVDEMDREALIRAVNKVVASYERTGAHVSACKDGSDQVLVQPMVQDISMSGVVFTQDLDSGAPYYVINYDDETGRHDTITAGQGDVSRTLLVRRSQTERVESPRFQALLAAVREIEDLVNSHGLDIEFAVTRQEQVFILQVRRIACQANWNRETTRRVDVAVEEVRRFVRGHFSPLPGCLGRTSVLGIMPDWNPAEMIGATPRRLAASLYRTLITDSTWAEARAEMGYRDMSGRHLMFSLLGRGYIDVRESFNSFLPAELPDNLGERLVDVWLDKLRKNPELHDRVEFEVAITMHALDFDERVQPELHAADFEAQEIARFKELLLVLTNRAVSGSPDLIATQLERVECLNARRTKNLVGRHNDGPAKLYAVRALLDDCRRLGVLPFSILARCAFMAEEFLRSILRLGLLTPKRAEAFRASVRTVLTNFMADVDALRTDGLAPEAFRERYGHLRPGTYDILSKRYDQRDYFGQSDSAACAGGRTEARSAAPPFVLTPAETNNLDAALTSRGYSFGAARLFKFMAQAIRGREYAKFCFTRNLSDALEGLAAWGEEHGLSREELSHLSVEDLLAPIQESWSQDVEDELRKRSKRSRAVLDLCRAVRLPFLISGEADVDVIPLLKCRPNFITRKAVRARVVRLTGREADRQDLAGRIVLIESADPGFDWIFASAPVGLVTKHGGSNSHMAIRCAELGLPAAIGCGEQLFQRFEAAYQLYLDCGAEMVTVISGGDL